MLERLLHQVQPVFAAAHVMDLQRSQQRLPHRLARIERRRRILEHRLHLAPHTAHLCSRQCGDVLTIEDDASGGGPDEAQDDPADGGFA